MQLDGTLINLRISMNVIIYLFLTNLYSSFTGQAVAI
jgi:hypothetical protein